MTRQLLGFALILSVAACDRPAGGGSSTDPNAPGGGPSRTKDRWAGFKPGSFARTKSVSDMGGQKRETEMTTTVLEVTADKVVIETETKMPYMEPMKHKSEMPLKADGPGNPPAGLKLRQREGSEEVTVAAGTFKCKWIETETDMGGDKAVTRVWECEDVPGFTVKSVMKTSGTVNSTTTAELIEYKVK